MSKQFLFASMAMLPLVLSACSADPSAPDTSSNATTNPATDPAVTSPTVVATAPNLSFVPNIQLAESDPVWLVELLIDEIGAMQASDVYVSQQGLQDCIQGGTVFFQGGYYSLQTDRPLNGTNSATVSFSACNDTPLSISGLGFATLFGNMNYEESWTGLMVNSLGLVTDIDSLTTSYAGQLVSQRNIGEYSFESGIQLHSYSSSYNGQATTLSFDVTINDVGQVYRATTINDIVIDGFDANPISGSLSIVGAGNQSISLAFNPEGAVISGNGSSDLVSWSDFDSQFEDISNRPL